MSFWGSLGGTRDTPSRSSSLYDRIGAAPPGDTSSQGGIGYALSFIMGQMSLLFAEPPELVIRCSAEEVIGVGSLKQQCL